MVIRIILADDHKILLEGLYELINKQPEMKIVGIADNGKSAVKLVFKHTPDIVVMGISMPDLNGIDAISQITSNHVNTKVIVLTMHDDKRYVVRAFKAGALGYLLKRSAFEKLINAIQNVINNKIYIDPGLSDLMLEGYVHSLINNESLYSLLLTDREREVLEMITDGKSTKEIATALFVSQSTIDVHRKKIMDKLDIHSIAGLTKFAIREGLTSLAK